ncbi:hypothetical protein NS220_15960 [Microbacterium testaceum]|uniref:Uncharacterized protein n=1 Tax=Microbacterium testaceum TaxID=2033 RepID=A0A147ETG6_MICTE|nr:hypothetical protein [Microbacterium testaceum]KTR89238.1 hypothetical protein NS220_15960 [Microbacterium testaceum]
MFETAIFTDVTREEAIDGADGFNFQAVSPGLDARDQRNIRELLLHQVSNRWPADAAEEDHPPTSAYVRRDDRLYFSRGASIGQTHNGRRGNQLTQAVVTGERDDILPHRPAQIHAATMWDVRRAPTRVAEPWFAPLQITDDFDTEAILRWAQDDPWVWQTLPAYLSMLADASGPTARKVMIVHDDLETVLRWFALGTLLLDEQSALDMEYRAFATEPFQTRAPLVGVHPALQQGAPLTGAHTIDLLRREVSPIEVTEASRRVVGWVRDLDTLDALGVIGVAQKWMPRLGVEIGAAGAEMVTGMRDVPIGREEWNLGIAVIQGLAENDLIGDLALYVDELGDAVAGYELSSEDDFVRAARAVRFTSTLDVPGLATTILNATLESLAKNPAAHTAAWVAEAGAAGTWEWPADADREQLAAYLADIIRGAPFDMLDELLSLALPLAPELAAHDLASVRERVVSHTLRHPEFARPSARWVFGDGIRDDVRARLVEVAASTARTTPSARDRDRVLRQLAAGEWDYLSVSGDPLEPWIDAARIARVPLARRARAIGAQRPPLSPATWELGVLDTRLPANGDVWEAWIANAGMDPDLRTYLVGHLRPVLDQDPKRARAKDVQAWRDLVDAVVAARPGDADFRAASGALGELIAQIPSPLDRLRWKKDRSAPPERKND